MLTCEKCGAQFVPSAKPAEVTSLRVLCESCEALRRAEKARAAASKSIAKPSAAPSTQPSVAKPAASAPAPAQHVAAKPMATTTAAAPKPVPAKTPPTPAVAAKPASAAAAPAAKAVAAPAKPKAKKEIHLQSTGLEKRESRTTMIGAAVALVVIAAAGVTYFVVKGKRDRIETENADRIAELAKFTADLNGFNSESETTAKELIAFTVASETYWKGKDIENQVRTRVAKANATIERAVERRDLEKRLAAVETILDSAATQSAETIADQRRTLDELENKASIAGADFLGRVGAARSKADRVYAERLLDGAKTAAAVGGDANDRAAIAKYTTAEDEIQKLCDKAYRAKAEDKETYDFFQRQYRQVIEESDALVERVFTPEVIERMPWRDLLTDEEAKVWVASAVAGFEHRFDKGVLHIIGPSAEGVGEGILSIGDREKWRDFVLEVEFTIAKAGHMLCFRLGAAVDKYVETWPLSVEGDGALGAGTVYPAHATYIGSKSTLAIDNPDFEPNEANVGWTMNRKGAIGIVVPQGADLKFTRFRIKVLR